MDRVTAAWIVIAVGAVGTFLLRASSLLLAERFRGIPDGAREALRMVPPAALAALVAPAVLRPGGSLTLFGPRPVAAALALVVAWRTRNVLATIVTGLVAVVLAEQLLG